MSNLHSAEAALTAELSIAKAGIVYYQSRVEALEKALAQLANIDAASGSTAGAKEEPKQPRAKVAVGKPAKQKKTKAPKVRGAATELPFTGGDYWPNLVTDQHQSGPDIFKAAIDQLGFTPTKDQIKKLAGRMTFALNTLVKEKKIQDAGSGRERRFFKA